MAIRYVSLAESRAGSKKPEPHKPRKRAESRAPESSADAVDENTNPEKSEED
jgi:hypothetical protein